MIYIREERTQKLPGETSLFVTFDYKPDIVNAIKSCATVKNYDKKTYTWEIPLTDLAAFLDSVCYIDDVNITLKEEELLEDDPEWFMFDYQKEGIN